jgi:hypothetical protein
MGSAPQFASWGALGSPGGERRRRLVPHDRRRGDAALLAGLLARRLVVPVVVLELLLGIVVGPQMLGLAHPSEFVDFFSSLGLGMLFFFAGYEIDFERIRGEPLRLAAFGWAISLVLAYAVGGLHALAGIVLSLLYTGSAIATTAIGTLIPILLVRGHRRCCCTARRSTRASGRRGRCSARPSCRSSWRSRRSPSRTITCAARRRRR